LLELLIQRLDVSFQVVNLGKFVNSEVHA
jgi:hypothetical protein